MTYKLNPHRHVKIWLTKDPNVFLNQENQLRLVRMRANNPGDVIHFVYSKNLLSEEAIDTLNKFCKTTKIIPIDIESKIIPYCEQNQNEMNLITLYQQEITALHEGGNLAAASDLLRWLSPIYKLGIYSDFDVDIKTKTLPLELSIEKPLLLNLGTLELKFGFPPDDNLECILVNNDIIAVAEHDDGSPFEVVKKIQQAIYDAYQYNKYSSYYDKLYVDIYQYIQDIGQQEWVAQVYAQLVAQADGYDYTEKLIQLNLPNPIVARKYIAEKKIAALHQDIEHNKNTNEQRQQLERNLYHRMLVESVANISGPRLLALALFEHAALPIDAVHQNVQSYSLFHYKQYGLEQAFNSKNSTELHTSRIKHAENMKNISKIGDMGDISWTEMGGLAVRQREENLNRAASKIIRLRSFFEKKKNGSPSSEVDSDDKNLIKLDNPKHN